MTPKQKLILVVDNTPLNTSVITGTLKDTYRITVATSAAKALVIAVADEKPDRILLDVMMPEMDG
jgi:putative two-component system response regulator